RRRFDIVGGLVKPAHGAGQSRDRSATAESVPFDQCDAKALTRCGDGGGNTGRPSTDHKHIGLHAADAARVQLALPYCTISLMYYQYLQNHASPPRRFFPRAVQAWIELAGNAGAPPQAAPNGRSSASPAIGGDGGNSRRGPLRYGRRASSA